MADIPASTLKPGVAYTRSAMITASGTWVVPAGVRRLKVFATSGGGAGGGSSTGDGTTPGQGGNAGGTSISEIEVSPGDTLTITIGTGGTGVSQANGNAGGATVVRIGNYIVAYTIGGTGGLKNSSAAGNPLGVNSIASESLVGGVGGGGGSISAQAPGGSFSFVRTIYSGAITTPSGITVSNGGIGGSVTGGGGGGGCSRYGQGGTGGNGVNSNIVGANGQAPASTSYGAAGGGAGGSNGSGGAAGGNGIAGVVEILY